MLSSYQKIFYTFLCGGCLLLCACGDDDADQGGQGGTAQGSGGQGGAGTGGEAQGGAGGQGGGGGQAEAFIVKGVSGEDVLLDRLWERGCIPGTNGNDWTDASRTLIGLDLTFTLVDYQNGSPTPDCENGRVGNATFTVEIKNDGVMIPITWVDPTGQPGPAPDGLEAVTEANGAEGLMTEATITPETQERADQLNQAMFCGYTDWAPNEGKEAVECLTGGFNPFKATLVVDDRTMPWLIYDGLTTAFDANGYPTDMANYLPHAGPFELR